PHGICGGGGGDGGVFARSYVLAAFSCRGTLTNGGTGGIFPAPVLLAALAFISRIRSTAACCCFIKSFSLIIFTQH
ncbi:MAG TPA: hypothetical protein DCP17_08695, partial [Ruminococcaceae bacterium]|nr:hypothetical protein [Oscillospiraceae bacterium]